MYTKLPLSHIRYIMTCVITNRMTGIHLVQYNCVPLFVKFSFTITDHLFEYWAIFMLRKDLRIFFINFETVYVAKNCLMGFRKEDIVR